MKNWVKKLKHHFHMVAITKTSPHALALGFAIGTFISILPTPFFNIWIGALVVLIYEKVNKYALFASLLFWNPITMMPVQAASYYLGNLLLQDIPLTAIDVSWVHHVYHITLRYLLGSVLIAIPISLIVYIILRLFLDKIRCLRNQ